jgi:hypothetical protein
MELAPSLFRRERRPGEMEESNSSIRRESASFPPYRYFYDGAVQTKGSGGGNFPSSRERLWHPLLLLLLLLLLAQNPSKYNSLNGSALSARIGRYRSCLLRIKDAK